jgi:hypothetical protein
MDGYAAKAAASESGDERVQSLAISVAHDRVPEASRDVSTSLDMTTGRRMCNGVKGKRHFKKGEIPRNSPTLTSILSLAREKRMRSAGEGCN